MNLFKLFYLYLHFKQNIQNKVKSVKRYVMNLYMTDSSKLRYFI